MAEKKKTLQEKIDERVQAWLNNASSITKGATSQFSTDGYRANTKEYLDSATASIEASRKEADAIRSILKTFGYAMGEDYTKSVLGYLDETAKYQDDILKYAQDDYDIFSKYASEEDYNAALLEAKKEEGLSAFDWKTALSEVDSDQAYIDAAKKTQKFQAALGSPNTLLSYYMSLGYDKATASRMIAGAIDDPVHAEMQSYYERYGDRLYEDTSKLQEDVNSRRSYANRAKNVQSAPRLEEEAKSDADFNSFVQKGIALGKEMSWSGYKNEIVALRGAYGETVLSQGMISGGDRDDDVRFARSLTEDQVNTYSYYLAKYGKDKADEYLSSIEESVNKVAGQDRYEGIKDSDLLKYLFSIEAGIDQFSSGVKSLFSDGYTPVSADAFTSQLVRKDLADNGFKLPDWMGGASVGQAVYDFGTTTSNMLPSILVGTVGNFIAPGLGGVLGSSTLGASAGGNAKAEAIRLGYDEQTASTYGLLIGGSEAALQYILGGISSLGSGVGQKVLTSVLGSVDNAIFRVAAKIGNSAIGKFIGNMLSEGTEEYLQGLLEPAIRNAILNENNEIRLNDPEAIYSAILGALSASFLEGPGTIGNAATDFASTVSAGRTFASSGQTIELANLTKNTFAADTVAYKIASKVNERTGAYTIGRLLNEVNASLSEQNKNDIKNALVNRGVAERDADVITEALETVVGVKDIDTAKARVLQEGLEINDTVASVMREVILNEDSSVNRRTDPFTDLYEIARQTAIGNKVISSAVKKGTASANIKRNLDSSLSRPVSVKRDGDFSEADIGYLTEQAALYDSNNMDTADFIRMAERSGMTAEAFSKAFRERYLQGTIKDEIVSENSITSYLDETTQRRAYVLGNIARIESDSKANQTTAKKKNTPVRSDSSVRGKVIVESSVTADNRRDISMKVLENIASMTGLKIYLYASTVNTESGVRVYSTTVGEKVAENGFFDPTDNSIHLDVNAGMNGEGIILFTAAHELTHFIAKWSKLQFGVLSDFVADRFNAKGISFDDMIRAKMETLKGIKSYDKLTTEEARWQYAKEEAVADAMETVFKSGRAVSYLAELRTQHEGLFNKIRGFIRGFIQRIRVSKAYKSVAAATSESAIISESEKAMKKLEKMFAKAVKGASENYAAAESVEIETDNKMYSKRSVDKNGNTGYNNDRQLNLTEDEEAAILAYKSGGSYLLNAKLREGVALDEYEQKIVDGLDKALAKLPTYEGKVYRNIQFDGFGDGEARKSFVAGHIIDDVVRYPAYTSTSTEIDGYPLDGNFVVRFEIESTSGRNMEGYGNNSESEVLFPRKARFVVDNIVYDSKGTPTIYLTEVLNEQATKGRGKDSGDVSGNHSGKSRSSHESDTTKVQQMSAQDTENIEMQSPVSGRNTGRDIRGESELQGIQAEVNSDIRYSRRDATDSDGNNLSAEQQEFFKNSKVRDENGNLLVMYHGTPSAGFTKFKSGSYFTQHKWYADVFQSPGASSISSGKTATNPDTYAVYLNIKKPFDTRNKTERDIFYNEYYRKWGTGTDLMESGLPDWLDGMDLQEFLEEMGYDYDGLILDEGGVGGYGEEIVSRGLSYVTFDSSQVKNITNKAPTSNPDIRYSSRSTQNDQDILAESELSRLRDEYAKVSKLERDSKKALDAIEAYPNLDELTSVISDDTATKEKKNEMMEDYARWRSESGYTEAYEKHKSFEGQARELRRGIERMEERLSKSLREKKYSEDEIKATVQKAVRKYHTTPYLSRASYLLTTGSMLDFSDGQGYRVKDHREISEILDLPDYAQYADGMIIFMNMGNIRLQTYGIDISSMPNSRQISSLRDIIFKVMKEYDEFTVDFSKPNGNSDGSVTYPKGVSSSKIISDIKNYFETGIVPEYENSLSDFLYSPRTNRTLLAEALESVAETPEDRKKLASYKSKIATAEELEKTLADLTERKKALTEAEAPKREISAVNNEIVKTRNRLDIIDKQILDLESTASLKRVLKNAKAEAKKKGRAAQKETDDKKLAAEKENKEKQLRKVREKRDARIEELKREQQERNRKRIERRNRTVTRNHILDIVNKLNSLLKSQTKERHIIKELQPAVASVLEAFNFDTVGADNRIAKYDKLIAEATDPDVIKAFEEKRDRIRSQGDKLNTRLEAMKLRCEKIKSDSQGKPEAYTSEIDAIMSMLTKTIEIVGNTSIRDMSMEQLRALDDLFKMIMHTVRETNKAWKNGKLEDVKADAAEIVVEINGRKSLPEEISAVRSGAQRFLWDELVPVYAFERLGSSKLKEYFWEFVRAQNVYARDLDEAKIFLSDARKKHGFSKWKLDQKVTLVSSDGRDFVVTLEHLMSIYAYAKRPQALEHMRKGGFFFDPNESFVDGVFNKTKKANAVGYLVDDFLLAEIMTKHLTNEQTAYVDEVQAYLTNMGEKGNEVSRKLWGIDIFNEEVYFPLKSVQDFIHSDTEQKQESSLKNDGMTKATVPGASNPIVLQKFDSVVADHIDRMSKYHAFVLPIDGLNKVLHYGTWVDTPSMSVTTLINSKFGVAATRYLEQFIRDMNGDVPRKGAKLDFAVKGFTNFKKTMVAFSNSTIIQQPTAIVRAAALVNAKYFFGKKVEKESLGTAYAEMEKYAPIVIIKAIGGFDAGGSGRSVDYLNDDTKRGFSKVLDKLDDASMMGAEFADKIGWTAIWEAVKREIADTRKDLDVGSEAYLTAVGERFTEVIVYTQVYDSTISRSGYMRSQNDLTKMMTAFMGEPTVSINMLAHAITMAKRNVITKKTAARWGAAVYLSMILASVGSSLIYALRDDDDDESYVEKYFDSLLEKLAGDLNPLNMLPYLRDIVSVFEGWDVERSDMTLVKNLKDAIDGLDSEKKSLWRKIEDMTGAVAGLFGLPVKNLLRTGREVYNLFENIFDDDAWFKEKEEKKPTYTDYTKLRTKDAISYFNKGKTSSGKSAVDEIIKAMVEAGKTTKEAKSSLRSSFTAYYKPIFKEAYKNGNTSECARIRRILKDSGLYDNYIDTYMEWQKEALQEKYKK